MNAREYIKLESDEKNKRFEIEAKKAFSEYENNRPFYENYVRDSGLQIKSTEGVLDNDGKPFDTFAIDLENRVLYDLSPAYVERGYSPDKATFGTCHELEHLDELLKLLDEKDGARIWARHLSKLKRKKRYQILDNCFDDIKMNRRVTSRAPSLRGTKNNLYKENLFPKTDYTDDPKHLQFAYALLREKMLPEEEIKLSPDVREEIEKLKGKKTSAGISILDYGSRPDVPMSMRLRVQDEILEPIYDRFFEEDVKKREEKKEKESEDKEGKGEGKEKESEGKGKPGEKKVKPNPEDLFKEDYQKYFDKQMPSVPLEKKIEAAKKYIEAKEKIKSVDELAEEAYVKTEGITLEELKEYRRFWQEIENIKNPETNEALVEELRAIFRKIITERKKPKFYSKYPEKEGEKLAFPAKAVTDIKAGVKEPEVWETLEYKEKPKELYGDFDVTLVCDRSGSMEGIKAIEQRKSAALVIEALKEFSDDLDEIKHDLAHDLNVRTEVWSFGDEAQVEVLKPLSKELTEKQRVYVYKKLADTPGLTKDFLALENIAKSIPEEDLEKIKYKKLKKIIFVMSDGQSDNPDRVQKILKNLREEKGALVFGIGITEKAEAIKETYAPEAQICKKIEDLSLTIGNLLKENLRDF